MRGNKNDQKKTGLNEKYKVDVFNLGVSLMRNMTKKKIKEKDIQNCEQFFKKKNLKGKHKEMSELVVKCLSEESKRPKLDVVMKELIKHSTEERQRKKPASLIIAHAIKVSVVIIISIVIGFFIAQYFGGKSHKENNDKVESISSLLKAIEKNPKDSELYCKIASLYFKDNKKKAFENYETCSKLDPQNAEAHYGIGSLFFIKKEYEKAIHELNMAYDIDPEIASPRDLIYFSNLHQGFKEVGLREYKDIQKSINLLEKCIEKYPKEGDCYFELGFLLHTQTTQVDIAHKLFEKAVDVNPDNWKFHFGLGRFYQINKQYEKAIENFETVKEMESENKLNLLILGICYSKIENVEEAVKNYEMSLKIDPNFEQALINYGSYMFSLGQYEKAKEYTIRGCRVSNSEKCKNNLIRIYEKTGEKEEGEQILAEFGFEYEFNDDNDDME